MYVNMSIIKSTKINYCLVQFSYLILKYSIQQLYKVKFIYLKHISVILDLIFNGWSTYVKPITDADSSSSKPICIFSVKSVIMSIEP